MIKYYADQRNSEKSKVNTYDLTKYDSIDCKILKDSFNILKSYDSILINEGPSFLDLVEIWEQLALLKKISIISSFNVGFRMEPFPVIFQKLIKWITKSLLF